MRLHFCTVSALASVFLLAGCVTTTVAPAPRVATSTGVDAATGTVSVYDRTPETADSLEVGSMASSVQTTKRTMSSGSIHVGENKANTVLTIYDDYACAYCRQFALTDLLWLEEVYVAKNLLRIEHVFVPQSPLGETMAKIALCSEKQNLLTETVRELYTHPLRSDAEVPTFAKKLKLNLKSLQACMNSVATMKRLAVMAERAVSAGVERVPTFQIGGKQWVGLEQRDILQKNIEEALQ